MSDVTLKVGADTSDADKSLKKFEANAKEVGSNVSNAFGLIKAAAAAAVAVFAGKQVIDFFAAGIQGAIDQENAMASLAQQMKLSGEFTEDALLAFDKFGDEMENTSKFTGDVVLSQIAVAKAMGLTNEQAQKLVQASIELSAATGDSLDSSVQTLGKTFDGVVAKSPVLQNALAGVSKEALASGAGIDAVLKSLGGTSAAQMETFAGSLVRTENAFDKLQESFGKIIIENSSVIAAIQGIGEIFKNLKTEVEGNESILSSFVTGAVQGLATAISLVVPSMGFFIRAFQGLTTVTTLAVGGFLTIADALGTTFAYSVGLAVTLILKLTDALGATDGAADKFEGFVDAQVKGLRKMTNATIKAAADNNESFIQFNKDYDKFGKTVDDVAQKVFDANEKSGKSNAKLAKDNDERLRKERESFKKREKMIEDFSKLEKQINNDTASGLEKIKIKRDEQFKEIERFEKAGIATKKQAQDLKLKLDVQYTKDQAAELDKQKEAQNKVYEENIKALKRTYGEQVEIIMAGEKKKSKIFKDRLTVDNEGNKIETEAVLSDEAKSLMAGLASSLISGVAQGADGAASTIAGAVGGIVGFFAGPGFGSIVREAIMLGFLDAQENADKVTGFFKEIPKLLENFTDNVRQLPSLIAEQMPAIVRQLVRGFPEFIKALLLAYRDTYVAIIETVGSIFSEVWKAASESIGIAAMDIGDAWRTAVEDIGNYFQYDFPEDMKEAGEAFKTAVADGIKNFVAGVGRAGSNFFNGIIPAIVGIRNALNEVGPKLVAFTADAAAKIGASLTEFRDKIANGASEFGAKMSDAYKGAADNFAVFFKEKLPEAFKDFGSQVSDAVKNFASGITDAANQFVEKVKGAFGGGSNSVKSGTQSLQEKAAGVFGAARGLTEVPPGFNNDTFPARLSSGERVVDNNTNQDLKDFLENAQGGGLGGQEILALLRQIAAQTGSSMAQVSVKIDSKVLGQTIVDLNRRNERLAAR